MIQGKTLSLDIAYRNLGWAFFEKEDLLGVGCIVVPKEKKSKTDSKAELYARNTELIISRSVDQLIRNFLPDRIVGELPNGSKSNLAAKLMSHAIGAVIGVSVANRIALYYVSPRDSKIQATGNPQATKGDMIRWMLNRYQDFPFPKLGARIEHVADAIAAFCAWSINDDGCVPF